MDTQFGEPDRKPKWTHSLESQTENQNGHTDRYNK
jgi:hypothetical protein